MRSTELKGQKRFLRRETRAARDLGHESAIHHQFVSTRFACRTVNDAGIMNFPFRLRTDLNFATAPPVNSVFCLRHKRGKMNVLLIFRSSQCLLPSCPQVLMFSLSHLLMLSCSLPFSCNQLSSRPPSTEAQTEVINLPSIACKYPNYE